MKTEFRVAIDHQADIVTARHRAREIANKVGLSPGDSTLVVTAVSEIARNIVEYAKHGELLMGIVQEGRRSGIMIVASDNGPGIPDISRAMQDGYSTGQSLGLGLPGAKRMMDEFELVSAVGKGTTITMKKWGQR